MRNTDSNVISLRSPRWRFSNSLDKLATLCDLDAVHLFRRLQYRELVLHWFDLERLWLQAGEELSRRELGEVIARLRPIQKGLCADCGGAGIGASVAMNLLHLLNAIQERYWSLEDFHARTSGLCGR